jgi:hypothetical protein
LTPRFAGWADQIPKADDSGTACESTPGSCTTCSIGQIWSSTALLDSGFLFAAFVRHDDDDGRIIQPDGGQHWSL